MNEILRGRVPKWDVAERGLVCGEVLRQQISIAAEDQISVDFGRSRTAYISSRQPIRPNGQPCPRHAKLRVQAFPQAIVFEAFLPSGSRNWRKRIEIEISLILSALFPRICASEIC